MTKRLLPPLASLFLLLAACKLAGAAPLPATDWTVTWSAAPDSTGPALAPQTIRQVVRTSVGGNSVRVRLSNLFGSGPLTVGALRVDLARSGGAIEPGAGHPLLFNGQAGVTIAPGQSVLSDPAGMAVSPLQQLALSLYLVKPVAQSTIHGAALQASYAAPDQDLTTATRLPPAVDGDSRLFITDVEVGGKSGQQTLVVVGDSISDGIGSTDGGDRRWTDALVERLQANPALASVAVSNAGIAGNRILRDGGAPFVGPSVLHRFERDALAKSAVRWVLLFEGINDISASDMLAAPAEHATAQQIIAGMKEVIRRAHAKHIKVAGATLLPYAGTKRFYSSAGEAKRKEVNAWIRSAGAFDAVADFDLALRDPAHPERMLPAFDSGDHLHPNDAGHKAMAAAVDLGWFAPR